jgi:hypothetical protein
MAGHVLCFNLFVRYKCVALHPKLKSGYIWQSKEIDDKPLRITPSIPLIWKIVCLHTNNKTIINIYGIPIIGEHLRKIV